MRFGRVIAVCAALAAALVASAGPAAAARSHAKPLPALTRVAPDALTRALADGEITSAKYALERARSLFARAAVSRSYGAVARPDPRATTLILRDLALRARQLSGADRRAALAILGRPTTYNASVDPDSYTTTEATPVCGVNVCVHYVTTTADAVDPTDVSPANGVPDYVDQALDVFDNQVWGHEVGTLGYRQPKSDTSSTNNGASTADPTGAKFDVYLANLGDSSLYGYCTTDDPNLVDPSSTYQFYDASAYCVVDNNFTESIFQNHTPLENLEVTAAHEFFHAVQFSYDAAEDQWLMEGTAVWMEDNAYTDINDNLQYMPDSPIAKPTIPLDRGQTQAMPCCHQYGDWIWFRFLSEWLDPTHTTQDPNVIREIWERADGSPTGVDDYSTLAVSHVLTARGKSFKNAFATFGWINRVAKIWYLEGASYTNAPLSASAMALSRTAPSRTKTVAMSHQTQRYYEFRRGTRVSSTAHLTLVFDLPSSSTGSAASALVFHKTGTVKPYRFALSSLGNGTFRLAFGSGVSKVDVVLTNASTRYGSCWAQATPYACSGVSLDDGRAYRFTARLS